MRGENGTLIITQNWSQLKNSGEIKQWYTDLKTRNLAIILFLSLSSHVLHEIQGNIFGVCDREDHPVTCKVPHFILVTMAAFI